MRGNIAPSLLIVRDRLFSLYLLCMGIGIESAAACVLIND